MSPPNNYSVKEILKRFSGIDLPEHEINDPATNAAGIIDKIDREATSMSMDVEPANVTGLLHVLAPKNLK